MSKKRPRTRARTEQRELARSRERLYQAREKLATLEPGGAPERPLEVSSASVVERRAEADPCLRCDGPVRAQEHTTLATSQGLLRVVTVRCPSCATDRRFYLQIVANVRH